MTSLKSLIPGLARALDMKTAALYERQRALVRAGLLEMVPGHGPGSGVRATPKSIALLLISIMATTSLSEVEEQTKIVANLKSVSGRCPSTGKKTFAAALAEFLESPGRQRIRWIDVERRGAEVVAEVFYKNDPKETEVQQSQFGTLSRDENYLIKSRVSLFLRLVILQALLPVAKEKAK